MIRRYWSLFVFGVPIAAFGMYGFIAGVCGLVGLWPQGKPFAFVLAVAAGLGALYYFIRMPKLVEKTWEQKLQGEVDPPKPSFFPLSRRQWIAYFLGFIAFGSILSYGMDLIRSDPDATRDRFGWYVGHAAIWWVIFRIWDFVQERNERDKRGS